jgi:CBS domain-containing protein
LSLVTDRKVHRISDGTSLEVALALMNMYRCSHLIVGDGPRATGLVSMRDVATQLLRAEEAAEERPHVAAEDESHRRPTASQDLTAVH